MAKFTDKQGLWEQKISTIEYRVLDLCVNIIDGYQRRLEEYEQDIDHLNVPISTPNYQEDHIGLRNSIITLQLLLGKRCLPRNCQYPETLENALRSSGMDEENISLEVEHCEDYLEKAKKLSEKSVELGERAREVTLGVLKEKRGRGETLTTEEMNALERIYEILSVDH